MDGAGHPIRVSGSQVVFGLDATDRLRDREGERHFYHPNHPGTFSLSPARVATHRLNLLLAHARPPSQSQHGRRLPRLLLLHHAPLPRLVPHVPLPRRPPPSGCSRCRLELCHRRRQLSRQDHWLLPPRHRSFRILDAVRRRPVLPPAVHGMCHPHPRLSRPLPRGAEGNERAASHLPAREGAVSRPSLDRPGRAHGRICPPHLVSRFSGYIHGGNLRLRTGARAELGPSPVGRPRRHSGLHDLLKPGFHQGPRPERRGGARHHVRRVLLSSFLPNPLLV
mmetsp:Transcript_24460/g.68572  ORF Transcript_24460/g.68572 Transcript_24460/m.68572 type:complete len:280 (+) Transcript_24460:382-1221(+)